MGIPGRLRVDVLGPLRVTAPDGADLTPTGALQRRLLALLVLYRGRVVSADVATDALWPGDLPAEPAAAIQNHMSRLRRRLPAGTIASVGDGYRLDAEAIDLDADRLAAFVAEPTKPDDVEAVLDRWRGPAFAELAEFDAARAEGARLDELRTRAREVRAELRLAAGGAPGLVSELQALADEYPLRERPRVLLIDALATTGRVPDALRVYDDFRRRLGVELGIEPSAVLVARSAELLSGGSAAAARLGTRLVHPTTSLVGRERLLGDVAARAAESRLVTLVGPGGVGKTRLLIELGHRLVAERPDRPVVFCELATGDADSAVDVVAAALGVDARPGVPLADRIADVLGTAEVVLLLDNCEHVLEPIAQLTEQLLGHCPNVRAAATSRERLRLAGEHVHPVPMLGLGDADAPAVRLFVDRARAVAPGFEPDAQQLARVTHIVSRLDGLPLAIELAAARLHTHDLDEVAAGLDDRFALLTTGQRTSSRHGSLGAAVAWSFGLLDPQLQETFAELSVFAGAFTAADAAAVCRLAVGETSRQLTELVERSLVLRTPDRRYMLLETLRAFGADRLRATGRAEAVAERHAAYQTEWLADARRRLREPGNDAIGDIEQALPELRTAFGWALEHERADLAAAICADIFDYGFFRLRPDVLSWAERALEHGSEAVDGFAVDLWVNASYAAWMAGDVPECGVRARRALDLAERAGGPVPAKVLTAEASFHLFDGNLLVAADLYHRAGETVDDDPVRPIVGAASELLARGYAGETGVAAVLAEGLLPCAPEDTCYAAYVWYCAGEAVMAVDAERARERFARAIEIAERTRTSFVLGVAGASKASLAARFGDPLDAAAEYRRLLLHWRRAGMWSTQWTMLRSVAVLLTRMGRHREAAALEGAIRATLAGHRIFGADEVTLNELSATLRAELGESAYRRALHDGAALDGNAAVELALGAL